MGKKLTAIDIVKLVRQHPNAGFDQCDQCQGIECQGAMKPVRDDIDTTELICDECSEANKCSNCGFDMGPAYENCGASEDGVCPDCGHDPSTCLTCEEKATHSKHCSKDACKYGDDDCPVVDSPQEPKARVWEVQVCRTSTAFRTIKVIAATEAEACDNAIDKAGGEEFGSGEAEYSTPDGAL